jgi:hypothetical protein
MQPFRRRPPGWTSSSGLRSSQKEWPAPAGLNEQKVGAPWLGKLFWGSLVFAVVAVVFLVWTFLGGRNTVSVGNVEVEAAGPTSVRSGEAASLQVTVLNHNNHPLEFADLILEYPPGTLAVPERAATSSPIAAPKPLLRERLSLGTVPAGEEVKHVFNALFFGDKETAVPINISLEYRLEDSNAIFKRQTVFNLPINSSPLSVNLALPTETSADQTLVIDAEVVSNATTPFANAALLVVYPPGWHFAKSVPPPDEGNNFWRLGTIEPGKKKLIQISGSLEGQDQEEKFFRLTTGLAERDSKGNLVTGYASAAGSLHISRPQVALTATLNDKSLPYVATSREQLRVTLEWVNNLPVSLSNAELTANLTGEALDKTSVAPSGNGSYQSNLDKITWNKLNVPELASIPPGGSGRLSFSFTSLPLLTDNLITNPQINLAFKWHAERATEGDGPTTVDTSLAGVIKLNSVVQLAAGITHSAQPGEPANAGTLPPKVGSEVAYTARWSLVNSSNDLAGVKVTATLPPYVRFLGSLAPAETLTFVPEASGGGQVIWDLGSVKTGTGLKLPPRAAAFRVAFTPSLSQVGQAPVLVGSPSLAASDLFTGASWQTDVNKPLGTMLSGDPAFHFGDDKVIP